MKKSQIKKEKAKSKVDSQQDSVKEEGSIKQEEGEVKAEQDDGRKQWFEYSDDDDDQNKWEYLQHHGVTFPDPYIPKGLAITFKGESIKLDAHQQELAWYWCQAMGTEYENNQIFRKNFQLQFTETLKEKYPSAVKLDQLDFTNIKFLVQKQKQEKKNKGEDQKMRIKFIKEQQNKFYGTAIVDWTIEKVNGYSIQPPTLFRGRGKHPKAGFLKPRIQPEELTLNLAQDAPIPKCHVVGHNWGSIECKKDSTWLCSYKNDTISSSSTYKYIFLAANSRFKGQNDRKKYEKARRLKRTIDSIRQDYLRKIQDKDMKNKQLGTATYLIDKLALRVGNQKGEDQADTQGCCSLRVEHIQNLENQEIKLDFLGKDSMQYVNTVKVIPAVWNNIKLFRSGKEPVDNLFDRIDAQALNDYLKSQMEGLTAKVFRTYNASNTLQQELNRVDLTGLSMQQKRQKYEQANRQVAILCNHQRTVSKKMVQSLNKKQQALQLIRQYHKQLLKHQSLFTAKRDRIDRPEQVVQIEGLKPIIKKFPETREATDQALRRLEARISKQEKLLKKKNDSKEFALGTSKTNYNDPRITVAWCKKNEVRVEKVFTNTHLSKFLWAMYAQPEFEF